MQASQSKNASDLLKPDPLSDPKLDSTFTRSLPSPFAAPIHAARRYFERPKGDACPEEARKLETGRHAGSLHEDLLLTPSQHGFEERDPHESSRERDRRLERSLYEGHSIEAGLNSECFDGGGVESTGRAYLADGDGSEALFPYAAPMGPLPNPEVVRCAISRLARQSEQRNDSAWSYGGDAGRNRERDQAMTTPGLTDPVKLLDFGEVARRVWGAEEDPAARDTPLADSPVPTISAPASHGVPEPDSPPERAEISTVPETKIPDGSSAAVAGRSPQPSGCIVEAEPALAHDACNLLSGLALYSELLGSPGVLGEPYRHYAEELKLLAGRSQVLIDRLLRVGAVRNGQPSPTESEPEVLAGAVEPSPDGLIAFGALSNQAAADDRAETEAEEGSATKGTPSTSDLFDSDAPGESTSMVDLLMRWGSLLSTLAHGPIEVVFGSHPATPVPAGAEALERILVNLVRNATAATVQGGSIRIGFGLADSSKAAEDPGHRGDVQRTVLTVDDSGCGMTELQVRRLLGEAELEEEKQPRPFEAVTSTVLGPERRHGLGLRIVRELVAASGGTISIQSWPGTGTRVEIRWPVRSSAALGATEPGRHSPEGELADSVEAESPQEGERSVPVIPIEVPKSAPGPDGFSEVELRAMMLRLHRSGPQERSPFSRRLGDRRLQEARPEGAIRTGDRSSAPAMEVGRGFSVLRSVLQTDDASIKGRKDAQQDAAAKGAIAC